MSLPKAHPRILTAGGPFLLIHQIKCYVCVSLRERFMECLILNLMGNLTNVNLYFNNNNKNKSTYISVTYYFALIEKGEKPIISTFVHIQILMFCTLKRKIDERLEKFVLCRSFCVIYLKSLLY